MKLCKKSKRKFRYVDKEKKIRQIIERQKKTIWNDKYPSNYCYRNLWHGIEIGMYAYQIKFTSSAHVYKNFFLYLLCVVQILSKLIMIKFKWKKKFIRKIREIGAFCWTGTGDQNMLAITNDITIHEIRQNIHVKEFNFFLFFLVCVAQIL